MSGDRPAAEGVAPGHYPAAVVTAGHVAPCPRRVRARLDGAWVLDTTEASYVWEHPYYPQYAVPEAALGEALRPHARPLPDGADLPGHVLVKMSAAEAWFEEEERVHGHPRSPYVRVDALRSQRVVTVRLDDRVLARAQGCVGVFETGLPPRWYVDPTAVDWSLLTRSDTVTRCPYKGLTSDYWSVTGDAERADVAWSYAAPTAALGAIAGLVSFDDTLVEVEVEVEVGRPAVT